MVVVTGATGFLGAHLVMSLLEQGHVPVAIKRNTSDMEEFNLIAQFRLGQNVNWIEKVRWVEADLLDILSLDEAFKGADIVFHCAAVVAFKGKNKQMYDTNVLGTANVVNACLNANVRKLVYASSTAAIGRTEKEEPISEKNQWSDDDNNTEYAITKHLAELEVWRGMEEGLDVLVFNPSIILGPGKWDKGSCKLFMNVKNGFKFHTQGINGFVGVKDVCKAMIQFGYGELKNSRFLLVSENITYKHLFDLIAKNLKVRPPSLELKPSYLSWLKIPVWIYTRLVQNSSVSLETLKTSLKRHRYDNSAIQALGFEFQPIDQVIEETCHYL